MNQDECSLIRESGSEEGNIGESGAGFKASLPSLTRPVATGELDFRVCLLRHAYARSGHQVGIPCEACALCTNRANSPLHYASVYVNGARRLRECFPSSRHRSYTRRMTEGVAADTALSSGCNSHPGKPTAGTAAHSASSDQ